MAGVRNQQLDVEEGYLCSDTLEFFREKLLDWRNELVGLSNRYMVEFKNSEIRESDPVDFGLRQSEKERDLIALKRSSDIIVQIDSALHRIEQGEYGYCQMTGEEIGIERLKVQPLATLSIDAQEEIERRGRLQRIYS